MNPIISRSLSVEEFHKIVLCWAILILFLTIVWTAFLRRFAQIISARQEATRSRTAKVPNTLALLQFLFRSEYKQTGDARLIAVCQRMRTLLYGYLGCVIAFVIFLAMMRPRY